MFPRGSRFVRLNTNDKTEASILDRLLDGNSDDMIPLAGLSFFYNQVQVTHITFSNNMAYVVLSPMKNKDIMIEKIEELPIRE
jgi:hypothetical protein